MTGAAPTTEASEAPANIEILSASTAREWRTVWGSAASSGPAPDDSISEARLREELGPILDSEDLAILTGSGTSMCIGQEDGYQAAPSMADLWGAISSTDEFNCAGSLLNSELVEKRNFEWILSDAHIRSSLQPTNAELMAFVNKAEGIVLDRCRFVSTGSGLESHQLFLRKVGRRSTRLNRTQLFTTNYDLAFEQAARNTRFNVIDGFGYGGEEFDGGLFDLDYVRRQVGQPMQLEPKVLHLLKLHGSVDWQLNDGRVTRTRARPTDPVLIYPSNAKYQQAFKHPYLEFMSRFQIALRSPDLGLIVTGFGFNDEHLVSPLESAVRSNIGLRLLIVAPNAKDSSRSAFLSWIESLISGGDRRLTLMKGSFEDLARFLPEVPAFEERDVHMNRLDLMAEGS